MGKIRISTPEKEIIKYTKKKGKPLYLVFILFLKKSLFFFRILELSKQKNSYSTNHKNEKNPISY